MEKLPKKGGSASAAALGRPVGPKIPQVTKSSHGNVLPIVAGILGAILILLVIAWAGGGLDRPIQATLDYFSKPENVKVEEDTVEDTGYTIEFVSSTVPAEIVEATISDDTVTIENIEIVGPTQEVRISPAFTEHLIDAIHNASNIVEGLKSIPPGGKTSDEVLTTIHKIEDDIDCFKRALKYKQGINEYLIERCMRYQNTWEADF